MTTFKYPTLNFHAVVTACLRPRSPPYPHNKHSLSSIHSAEDHNQIPKLNIGSPITACLWSTVTPLPQLQAFPQLNTVQRTTTKYLHWILVLLLKHVLEMPPHYVVPQQCEGKMILVISGGHEKLMQALTICKRQGFIGKAGTTIGYPIHFKSPSPNVRNRGW